MLQDLTEALATRGLVWKESSLKMVTARGEMDCDVWPWVDASGTVHNLIVCSSIETLGGCIGPGAALQAARQRVSKANTAFWSHKTFYCSRKIPLDVRLFEYQRRVQTVLAFAMECQVMLKQPLRESLVAENNFLRAMCSQRKGTAEDWKTYWNRFTEDARQACHSRGYSSVLTVIANAQHSLVGRIFGELELEISSANRAAAVVLVHRSSEWCK